MKQERPTNIARAFRAVALDIIQDFVFDYVPDHLRGLKDENFNTLFVRTTFDVMDWTAWCFRNFPSALIVSDKFVPQWLRRRILPGEAANVESFNVRLPRFSLSRNTCYSGVRLRLGILDNTATGQRQRSLCT